MVYDPPPSDDSSLYQGEVLGGIVAYRVLNPPEIIPVTYPLVIIVHNDCDLAQDHVARSTTPARQQVDETSRHVLPQVLLVALYEADSLRDRFAGSELRKRGMQNQDERYHHIDSAAIGSGVEAPTLAEFLIDFRRVQGLPPANLYDGIRAQTITRVARLPLPFMNDLVYRCFTYLGRMGIPDTGIYTALSPAPPAEPLGPPPASSTTR